MNEWKWSKANEKDLAKFVNGKAIELLPKLPVNRFDLVQNKKGRRKLVEAIYNNLVSKKITYTYEKYHPEEEIQLIRTPSEILSSPGEGTCLDLALLFCGLCFGCDLLPLLIVIDGHALAAVSLNYKRNDGEWNAPGRRELQLFQGENGKPELLAGKKKLEKLQQLIDDEAYIAIECTGFTHTNSFDDNLKYPEARERENGFLDFSRALEAGSEQLSYEDRPFKFAIDIATAQYSWKIEPLEIANLSNIPKQDDFTAAARIEFETATDSKVTGNELDEAPSCGEVKAEIIGSTVNKSKIVGNKIGDLKKKSTHKATGIKEGTPIQPKITAIPFDDVIATLTKDFTGREWLFEEIDNWLANSDKQFFILTGEPGLGKSAIAAQFIQNQRDKNNIVVYHFCIAGRGGTTEPNNVLQSLAAQLMKYFPYDYAEALVNTIKPFHLSVNVNITIETIKNSEVQGMVINNLYTSYPQEVLDIVLRKPLKAIDLSQTQKQAIVILIDSLDEAVTYKEEENIVTLLSQVKDLPSWVRFICTTRQERRVLSYLETLKPFIYHLKEQSKNSLNDISQYIIRRFNSEKIHEKLDIFKVDSPTLVDSLTDKSSSNFLYTKLILNEIELGYQPLDQLDTLPSGLYGIYHEMLRRRCSDNEWENKYQPILGTLAVTQAAVTETQLVNFTKNRQLTKTKIKQNLRVLIQFTDIFQNNESKGKTYTLFHQSFRDYLLDEKKNEDFYCDAIEQHQEIINFYKKETHHWNDLNQKKIDSYGLLYLPKHLKLSEQKEELYTLLTGSPKWMEAKSITFGNVAYVDDLNLAIDGFADPLEEPNQIVTLIKLYTAQQVVNQRVSIPNLRTLVHLGREVEARSYARLREDSESKLNCLLAIHYALQELGQFVPDILDEAEDVVDGIREDYLGKAKALIKLAEALVRAKLSDKAKALLHKAAEVAEKIQEDHNRAKMLTNLAAVLVYAEDFSEAEKVATAAEKSARAIGSYFAKAQALIEVAEVLAEIGCRTKVEHLFTEAQNVAGKDEDGWRQAYVLTKLAIALALSGSNETDSVFKKAEQVADAIPKYWQRIDRMIELAVALAQTERKDEAKSLLIKVNDLINSIDENDNGGIVTDQIQLLAVALAHVEEFNLAETVANVIEDKPKQVEVLCKLAVLAHGKDGNKTRDFFTKAEEVAGGIESGWELSTAFSKLAEALEETNNFNEAEKIATTAQKVERAVKENWRKPEILSKLATVLAGAEYDDNKVSVVFREAKKAVYNLKENLARAEGLSKLAVALVQSGRNAELILTELDKAIYEILNTEKTSLVLGEEELKKSQLLIKLTVNLAQAKDFSKAENIANTIHEDILKAEAQSKLAVELALAQAFSEAKKVIQRISYEPAKSIPFSKLAVALAHTENKEADKIFSIAEKVALSIEEDNNSKPWILIELVAALAQAKKFDKAIKIIDLINKQWAKAIALSKLATAYALLKSFTEAENVVSEAENIAREIENNIYYLLTMNSLTKTLAQIKFFKKALSIVGLKETPSEFLATLMEYQPAFEQFLPGLLAKILQESIYIFGWEDSDWHEIDTILSTNKF
ncbi:ATP-binding protein [Microcoleus sp. Pol12A5]|uniref:ATP-binding protein n=1 Tax=Microcoleus sp. Pol12A5 TaxID=3055392 RepID=UPI002FD5CD78